MWITHPANDARREIDPDAFFHYHRSGWVEMSEEDVEGIQQAELDAAQAAERAMQGLSDEGPQAEEVAEEVAEPEAESESDVQQIADEEEPAAPKRGRK